MRRPQQHWRRVPTRRGKILKIINRGISYPKIQTVNDMHRGFDMGAADKNRMSFEKEGDHIFPIFFGLVKDGIKVLPSKAVTDEEAFKHFDHGKGSIQVLSPEAHLVAEPLTAIEPGVRKTVLDMNKKGIWTVYAADGVGPQSSGPNFLVKARLTPENKSIMKKHGFSAENLIRADLRAIETEEWKDYTTIGFPIKGLSPKDYFAKAQRMASLLRPQKTEGVFR